MDEQVRHDDRDVLALPFDQYQRYRAIQQTIDAVRPKARLEILDIGGFPGVLRGFLPEDRIVVADMRDGVIPGYVKADALDLPFGDRAFDVVIAVDVLEHIPKADRERFLTEVSRVSGSALVIAAPFDTPDVAAYEELMNALNVGLTGKDHDWLIEHITCGLPDIDETVAYLKKAFPAVKVVSNGYLPRWLKMTSAYLNFSKNEVSGPYITALNRFYNERFYRYDNKPASYRKIVAAHRAGFELDIPEMPEDGFTAREEEALDLLIENVRGLYLRRLYNDILRQKDDEIKRRDLEIAAKARRIEDMLASNSWRLTAPLRCLGGLFRRDRKDELEDRS